ncbi:MAG: hypothetical protein NTW29_10330 [Bacteroidetes bacterium]|nr:hypothetical protein [Bacteroidota bacterium]
MTSSSAFAQTSDAPPMREPDYNKPKLFNSLPEQIPVDIAVFNNLLSSPVGSAIDQNFGAGTSFRFAGQVVSAVSKYENRINSVVIRSTNFNGARFSFTRTLLEDGSITYTGRLISKEHGDVYELQKINNNFVLVKRNYFDLVNE